MRKGCPLCLSR